MASSEILEHELAAWIVQSLPESCDAEGLAGASSDHKVNCSTIFPPIYFCHVAQVGHVGVMVRQDGFGEWVDFRVCDGFPAEWFPGYCRGFDAAEQADVFHAVAPFESLIISIYLHVSRSSIGVSKPSPENLRRASALIVQASCNRLPRPTLQEPHDANQPHAIIRNRENPRQNVESPGLDTLQVLRQEPVG